MPQETFTVVALPWSRTESRPFHVSLFIAPNLVPDGAEGELRDFEHWVEWSVGVSSAEISLFNQLGEIACEPVLEVIDASVWSGIFPPDTPVRAREAPDWDDRHWRTFRASEVHDTAKLFSVFSMMTSPTERPKPDPRRDFVSLLMGTYSRVILDNLDRSQWDESIFTRAFDRLIGEPSVVVRGRPSLSKLEKQIGATEGLQRAFLELHRARRFYERPEGQMEYERTPVEGAVLARPPRPEPDFHERVALLGDHPGVLRKLGLVIDLRVDDLGALSQSQFLRATLGFVDGLQGRSPETSVQVVGGDMVVPSSEGEWSGGRLRLGDEDRYKVLDMDADGSALKTDRFLWTVPRLMEVANSGVEESTATPAHRTGGFTITRAGRALRTQSLMTAQRVTAQDLTAGVSPRLDASDVIQGLRLEVWDDKVKEWFSLHRRRVDVEVLGHGTVLEDVTEEGFSQGTTASETARVENSPIHVHEGVVSWGGWSLSAPRPGRRVRHENGDEIVEETTVDPDPVTPVVVEARAEPGTLPLLRYGRSYAFRAWGVDLAGNSRPHSIGPVPTVPSRLLAQVTATLASLEQVTARPVLGAVDVAAAVRSSAGTVVLNRRSVDFGTDGPPVVTPDELSGLMAREAFSTAGRAEADRADAAGDDHEGADGAGDRAGTPGRGTAGRGTAGPTGDAVPIDTELNGDILRRLRVRRNAPATRMGLAAPLAGVGRSTLVEREFGDLVIDAERPAFADVARRIPEIVAGGIQEGDPAAEAVDTVTALRPFLRWEPVQPPAVVMRHGNSPGESLLQLVIRSGVTQDRQTLELAVSSPTDYAEANPGHRYRATSERHLAPPKTSQSEAELHGMFDFAIGSTDPTDHAAAVAWIVRESGTLFDVEVPRLDDPHTHDPQAGIALVKDPGTPDSTLKTLPLPTGEMPAPGQYIVHDTDELALPYLPDPLGRGISLVFPDAGRDRQLQFPFGGEGFTAAWPGEWPALEPFRLVLAPTDALTGDLTDRTLTIGLPPGDIQRFRLSSSMRRSDLDLFGFWRLLPTQSQGSNVLAEAAADGWMWVFTPYDQVTLVHAVPRPLEIPRPTVLNAVRVKGSTDSGLAGAIDVHGPSTEQLTAAAAWTEYTDDLSLPTPETAELNGIGFITAVRPEEDLAVLYGGIAKDVQIQIPNFGPVWFHRAVHQWGDTKHRRVRYQFRASTRFREYFEPTTLVPDVGGNGAGGPELLPDDGQSVVGPERILSVPSSANPAAPIVHSVLPLFRWETGTEPEQPVGVRRSRRAGIRIYLERPWYSSGEGELLGVLIAPGGVDAGIENVVSQWGQDPVWRTTPVYNRALAFELDDLMHSSGLDDRPEAARPVTEPVTLRYEGVAKAPNVTVLGYRPEFSVERGLWFVDVAIDPGDRIWPFVRLAICRYQPESLPGCELSPPVKCDFQQLLPERTASVSRTDVRHVRVVVSGAIGTRGGGANETFPPDAATRHNIVRRNRIMVARLQRTDPDIPTDLGWDTVDTVEMIVQGTGRTPAEAAWVGELGAPEDIPLARPGSNPDWRVTIEEWEILPGDPDPNPDQLTAAPLPSWRRRLVYAESLLL